jgi:hypothetical protein
LQRYAEILNCQEQLARKYAVKHIFNTKLTIDAILRPKLILPFCGKKEITMKLCATGVCFGEYLLTLFPH